MGKTYENVFLGARCYKNLRLLSETFLRVNSHFSWILLNDSKVKLENRKI